MTETLGGAVRRRRRQLGVTQQSLAADAGLSVRALRDIEQGRVRRPRLPVVRGLATALGLTPAEEPAFGALLGGSDAGQLATIGVLGPLTVLRHGVPVEFSSGMQRHLLGLLALHPNATVSRDEIVDVLWGEQPPRTYLSALHSHVTRLRRILDTGPGGRTSPRTVVPSRGGYRLEVEAERLDVLGFAELDARARARLAAGELAAAEELFTEALRCWRGPVLVDGGHGLRGHPAAVALGRQRLAAALSLADVALERGTPGRAIGWLHHLAADEPMHEGLHAKLMLALAASGEQSAALSMFADIQARLAEELGVQPGPEIQQAHLRIVRQEVPSAVVPGPRTPAVAGGIAPAQLPLDVRGFTGRDGELARLDAILGDAADHPTAAVISAVSGTAGVGKTALAVHWAHRVRDRFPDGQL
jgi:DNA-binding SARP family transcriptional activator/DNA-binding XRE family transcriptional regulator